jgi:hypothetical protein
MKPFYFRVRFTVSNTKVHSIGFCVMAQDSLHAWVKLTKDMATAFEPNVKVKSAKEIDETAYWEKP